MIQVKHPQDFWSGALFAVVGAGAIWIGRVYAFGTATKMGPGFLPNVLAWSLVLIGLFLMGRALVIKGAPLNGSAIRPQAMILAAIFAFALLIERIGLAPTVIVVAVLAALASKEMRWKETIPLGICMAVLSVLLFIYLLGQSMQPWAWSF
jgi:hypothetical protein